MARITHEEALERVFAERVAKKDGFCEIPTSFFLEKIDVNMPTLPQVAFYRFKDGAPELIKAADQGFSPLALSVHESLWIREDDYRTLKKHVEGIVLSPGAAKNMPLEKRMEILRKSAMLVVEDLFAHPSPENINRSTKVVSSFVYVLMKDPKAYLHLSKLSSHDPYTLQHSVGTAVNSIILGKKIGITDEKTLFDVGMGGLLHDIGKVSVRVEVINKEGPLDELEWEEMRQHSAAGYEIVKDNPQLSERTKRAILEHHEDRNGTGYPNKLKHTDIDVASKIVCLADIFNALTTNRTYSKARSPFDAFQLMREKLAHKIDEELFAQMVLIYGGKLGE